MNKKVYVLEESKKVVTIISDRDGIKVRGEAVCHPEDTFDAEFGTKLSDAIAMKKYNARKLKNFKQELVCSELNIQKMLKEYTQYFEIAKTKKSIALAEQKLATSKQELADLLTQAC